MPRRKIKRGKRGPSKSVGRAPKRTIAKKEAMARPVSAKGRVKVVIKNLILFAILFVISVVIASVSTSKIIIQLFSIIAILSGFVALALLIVLLVFLFTRAIKK